MKVKIFLFLFGLFLLLTLFLLNEKGGQNQIEQTTPIKIGVIAPLSGALSRHGEWIQNGVKLATQDFKALNVELIFEDTKCLPAETATALQKLKNFDKIKNFIGSFCGGEIKVAAERSTSDKMVGITPADSFGKLSEYFFSTQLPIAEESIFLAQYSYKNLGLKKIALLFFNNDFGMLHRDAFQETFTKLGGTITNVETIQNFSQTDFRSELTKIKANNPDGIFIAYSAPGNIINQIKELDIKTQIFALSGLETPELLSIAGKNAEGIIYTYRGSRENEKSEREKLFQKKYQENYGEPPGSIAGEAYDAAMILFAALVSCEKKSFDNECVKEEILKTENYSGATGIFSISSETNGAINKPIILKTIQNGEFVEYVP